MVGRKSWMLIEIVIAILMWKHIINNTKNDYIWSNVIIVSTYTNVQLQWDFARLFSFVTTWFLDEKCLTYNVYVIHVYLAINTMCIMPNHLIFGMKIFSSCLVHAHHHLKEFDFWFSIVLNVVHHSQHYKVYYLECLLFIYFHKYMY